MEIWDIYDKDRVKTGRVIERGQPLASGDYHLVVHIWMVNSKGEFLIQKRAPTVKLAPNVWATTGGSAVVGEDSKQALLREAKEELGIDIDIGHALVVETLVNKDWITDVWLVQIEAEIDTLSLQEIEVSDARWANYDEIVRMTGEGTFWRYSYLEKLPALIRRLK